MPSPSHARTTGSASAVDRLRPLLHATELLLAVGVLLVGAMAFNYLPQPYSAWPSLGSIPVTPQLVVPSLLGLAAITSAVVDRSDLGSILLGCFGGVTLAFGGFSLSVLYAPGTGGVFFIGLFTLVSGIALAVGVLGYRTLRSDAVRAAVYELRARISG